MWFIKLWENEFIGHASWFMHRGWRNLFMMSWTRLLSLDPSKISVTNFYQHILPHLSLTKMNNYKINYNQQVLLKVKKKINLKMMNLARSLIFKHRLIGSYQNNAKLQLIHFEKLSSKFNSPYKIISESILISLLIWIYLSLVKSIMNIKCLHNKWP